MSLRVATGGNVNAGKSTLTACLFSEVDDGRGTARATLFQHQHEKESGRTSTVTTREGRIGDRHIVIRSDRSDYCFFFGLYVWFTVRDVSGMSSVDDSM